MSEKVIFAIFWYFKLFSQIQTYTGIKCLNQTKKSVSASKPVSVKSNQATWHSRQLIVLTAQQDMNISVPDLLAGLTQTTIAS